MHTINTSDKVVQRNDFSCSTQYVSEAKPLSKFGEWFFSNKRDFNIQINDIRQIPVIIPSEELLKELHFHFERAVSIKKEDAKNMAIESNSTAIKQVEEKINFIVENLYGI